MGYEIPRNDKDFNLDNITDEQLFSGIKQGILECMKKVNGLEDITIDDIKLNKEHSNRREFMANDSNLYPKILLSTTTMPKYNWKKYMCADFLITPFTIQMLLHKNGLETLEPEELEKAFVDFMCETFPESNYLEKREEYFNNVDRQRKFYNKMIMGN